ncbi:MAG: hypothetical protein JRF33_16655 [Deltaproteobacteria bacterium]|nr:hypothetical protein [Deltaproteobacteria bacterium]
MHRILWLCGILMMAAPSAWAWDFEGRFRVQLGQEFDSNALRVYGERDSDLVRPDFLTRLVVKAQLAAAHDRNRFSLDYLGGARLFYSEHDEHLLATRLLGRYSHLLPHRRKVGLRLGLMDTSQVVHSRDYLLFDGEVFAGLPIHASTRLEAFAGGRHFNFKPDRDREVLKFSHLGPSMGLRLQSRLSPSWTARLSYRFELRFFDSPIIEDNLDTSWASKGPSSAVGPRGSGSSCKAPISCRPTHPTARGLPPCGIDCRPSSPCNSPRTWPCI